MNYGNGGLFARVAIPDEARSRIDEAIRKVNRADVDTLLTTDLEVLIDDYLTELGEARILWDDATMSEPTQLGIETQRDILGNSYPLSRVKCTITVPIVGDPLLLTYRSHQGAPMVALQGAISRRGLELTWMGDAGVGGQAIKTWIDRQKPQIDGFCGTTTRTSRLKTNACAPSLSTQSNCGGARS